MAARFIDEAVLTMVKCCNTHPLPWIAPLVALRLIRNVQSNAIEQEQWPAYKEYLLRIANAFVHKKITDSTPLSPELLEELMQEIHLTLTIVMQDTTASEASLKKSVLTLLHKLVCIIPADAMSTALKFLDKEPFSAHPKHLYKFVEQFNSTRASGPLNSLRNETKAPISESVPVHHTQQQVVQTEQLSATVAPTPTPSKKLAVTSAADIASLRKRLYTVQPGKPQPLLEPEAPEVKPEEVSKVPKPEDIVQMKERLARLTQAQ